MTSPDDVRLDETGSVPAVAPSGGTRVSSNGDDGGQEGDDGGLPELGAVVGSYRLLEVIGTGGMGRVYKAEHTLLGKKVALKMLRRRYAQSPDAVQRFFSEARAVTRIEHDNLVDVTDFIETEQWPPCFVMQLLRGRSLSRAIRDDGPFAVPRLLGVAAQTASAVAAVHAASIVHRDLKPANIFLAQHRGGGEVVKLLDFGVAKLLDEQGISMHDTNAGVPIGTPDYMAPEQVTGSARIDHRVDIWSLGAVLYECATGRLPFKASSFGELVLLLLSRDVVSPNELRGDREPLPKNLELLILQCLHRVPAQRPSSMQELHERLVALAAPYGLSSLDGGGFSLLETTDPGIPATPISGSAPAAAVTPSELALDDNDDNDDLDAGGPPTGEIPGAMPRRFGAKPLAAAAAAILSVVVALVLSSSEPPAEVEESERPQEATATTVSNEMITLAFGSTPPGASIFLEGKTEALGVTPFDLEVPHGQVPLPFEARLDGHAPVASSVTPDQSRRVELTLEPVVVPRPPADTRKQRRPRERPEQRLKKTAPEDKDGLMRVF